VFGFFTGTSPRLDGFFASNQEGHSMSDAMSEKPAAEAIT
jgi:hypothetical protein